MTSMARAHVACMKPIILTEFLAISRVINVDSSQITGEISCDGIVTKDEVKARNTLHFTSDGTHIYWLYTTAPPLVAGDKEKNKQEQVYLEMLIVKVIIVLPL